MSLFSKLFGSGKEEAKGETYQGFTIIPKPMKEGSQFRLSALIEKDGKEHHLIRADMLGSQEEAASVATAKAKQLIDQMGEKLF